MMGLQITCNKLTDQDEPYTSTDEDNEIIGDHSIYVVSVGKILRSDTLSAESRACVYIDNRDGRS